MKKILVFFSLLVTSCYKPEMECTKTFECRTIQYSYVQCEYDEKGNPIFFDIKADTSLALINECDVQEYIKQAYDARKRTYESSDVTNKRFMDKYPVNCNCSPSNP